MVEQQNRFRHANLKCTNDQFNLNNVDDEVIITNNNDDDLSVVKNTNLEKADKQCSGDIRIFNRRKQSESRNTILI